MSDRRQESPCLRVEFGSFIFSIINVILFAVLSVTGIVSQILINIVIYNARTIDDIQYLKDYGFPSDYLNTFWCDNVLANVASVLALILINVQLTLAVMLIRGLCMNNVSNVRKYLVFSGMHNLAVFVIGEILTNEPLVVVPAVLYAMILMMIFKTYQKMMRDKQRGFPIIDDDMPTVILV